MATEQLGVEALGSTTFSRLFAAVGNIEVIPCVFDGSNTVTLTLGTIVQDSATAGFKVGFTNTDSYVGGMAVLMSAVATDTTGGNVTANGVIAGVLKSSVVTDDAGAAPDAALVTLLQTHLPKITLM